MSATLATVSALSLASVVYAVWCLHAKPDRVLIADYRGKPVHYDEFFGLLGGVGLCGCAFANVIIFVGELLPWN